jgi:hypothetical protein
MAFPMGYIMIMRLISWISYYWRYYTGILADVGYCIGTGHFSWIGVNTLKFDPHIKVADGWITGTMGMLLFILSGLMLHFFRWYYVIYMTVSITYIQHEIWMLGTNIWDLGKANDPTRAHQFVPFWKLSWEDMYKDVIVSLPIILVSFAFWSVV